MKPKLIDIEKPVAILDEHWLEDNDGNRLIYLNERLLQKFADNGNKRIKATGDETPLVVGHTKDEADEKTQPEIVGYAREFSVKPFFKTGRKALYCKWRVYEDKVPLLRKFPRRSVEIWLKRMEIDPISLLGATTPDRDLGLVRLAEKGESFQYSIPEEDMDQNELVEAVLAKLQQSDMFKKLEQLVSLLDEEQAGGDPTGDMAGGDPAGEVPPMEGMPDAAEAPEGDVPPEVAAEEEAPVKTEEEPPIQKSAMGSGTNTMIAGEDKMKFSALEQELAKLRELTKIQGQSLNLMIRKSRNETRKAQLLQLQAEQNLVLDPEEEVGLAENDNDEQWTARVGVIRKRYSRSPVGIGRIPTASMNTESGSAEELVTKAVEISLRTGQDYDTVLSNLSQ